MSTSDKSPVTVRLTAYAENGTEIFVIDGAFRKRASALNNLDVQLPPGLYSVKFKRGDAIVEVDADLLGEGKDVQVYPPNNSLGFTSAAPIEQTTTSHEYHQNSATDISRHQPVEVHHGGGSMLFLFVRDVDKTPMGNPAEGLILADAQGNQILCLTESVGVLVDDKDTASWFACNLELDPGFYRLKSKRPSAFLEQSVILSRDWQTQVFLVRSWGGSLLHSEAVAEAESPPGLIDFDNGAVFLAKPYEGFDPQAPSLRLTELVNKGRSSGRFPVSIDDLREMLYGKFNNPMLGLLAANMLIQLLDTAETPRNRIRYNDEDKKALAALQRFLGTTSDGIFGPLTRDRVVELLREVTDNLTGMLGDHPDVYALETGIAKFTGRKPEPRIAASPAIPMLRDSWSLLLRNDFGYKNAGPDELPSLVADRLYGGGPWMIWESPEHEITPGERRPDMARLLKQAWRMLVASEQSSSILEKAELTPFEERAIHGLQGYMQWIEYLEMLTRKVKGKPSAAGRHAMKEQKHIPARPAPIPPDFSFGAELPEEIGSELMKLADELGLPYSTITRNLKSALFKMGAVADKL